MQSNHEREICRHFINGYCRYGNNCKFNHPIGQPKTKICKFYLRGFCRFGNSCMHTHAVKMPEIKRDIEKCPTQSQVVAKILEYENEAAYMSEWSIKKFNTSYTYSVTFYVETRSPWWRFFIMDLEHEKNKDPGIAVLFNNIHLHGRSRNVNLSISIPLYTKMV